jgi:hypothetical protein
MKWAFAMIAGLLLSTQAVQAGAVGGPKKDLHKATAGQTVRYTITFRGGENARLAVVGSGTTDIDVFVYDENGNLLRKGVGGGDSWKTDWNPRWTGKFYIYVINRGNVANTFALATN